MRRTRRPSNPGRPIESRRPCKPSCSSRRATRCRKSPFTMRRKNAAWSSPSTMPCGPRPWRRWKPRNKPRRGPRPLPLLNDPRCPRCSLLPICLPDEVHQQRGDGPPALPATRRLWPPRDEGLHLVAQRRGTRIGVRGGGHDRFRRERGQDPRRALGEPGKPQPAGRRANLHAGHNAAFRTGRPHRLSHRPRAA